MKSYTVQGKRFTDLEQAVRYMDTLRVANYLHARQLDYVDSAVEKSDLKEAKEVLSYIMEK